MQTVEQSKYLERREEGVGQRSLHGRRVWSWALEEDEVWVYGIRVGFFQVDNKSNENEKLVLLSLLLIFCWRLGSKRRKIWKVLAFSKRSSLFFIFTIYSLKMYVLFYFLLKITILLTVKLCFPFLKINKTIFPWWIITQHNIKYSRLGMGSSTVWKM